MVDAKHVGSSGLAWWASGHDDHDVARPATAQVQHGTVDLSDHVVGMSDARYDERLDGPRQGQLAPHRLHRREGEKGDRGAAARHPSRRRPGLGEGYQRPGVEGLGDGSD